MITPELVLSATVALSLLGLILQLGALMNSKRNPGAVLDTGQSDSG